VSRRELPFTALVYGLLIEVQDFLTAAQIEDRLRLGGGRVSAALHHLCAHRAVGVELSAGELRRYATPEQATRTYLVRARKHGETRNRRPGLPHPRRRRNELPKRDLYG
jgi:hypothetical protein